jgi:pyrroloquinoline quinone biosynthesis protein D
MVLRLDQRPRLSPCTSLAFEAESQTYSLQSPERVLRLNPSALEVVRRCTGELTVLEIIDQLSQSYALKHALGGEGATAQQVTADVLGLLRALIQRQLITSDPVA